MELSYKKNENDKYIFLREVLKEQFKLSSKLILKLKNNKSIYINDSNYYLDKKLNVDDIIKVNINFIEDNSNVIPIKMDLHILYEDEYLLVIDKPPMMPVHPTMYHYTDTLSNGVKYYYDSINLNKLIRPINRLDKNTSRNCFICKKRIYTR